MGTASDLRSLLSNLDSLIGVGVDVEQIARFRGDPDLRIFSDAERRHCADRADPAECLAGRWCAKEATVKALGGLAQLVPRDVQIVAAPDGRPIALLPQKLRTLGVSVEVSISHTAETAVAIAVVLTSRS